MSPIEVMFADFVFSPFVAPYELQGGARGLLYGEHSGLYDTLCYGLLVQSINETWGAINTYPDPRMYVFGVGGGGGRCKNAPDVCLWHRSLYRTFHVYGISGAEVLIVSKTLGGYC